jgi:RNA polymerase sigma-70 factor (ECF subfamily)
MTPSRPDHSTLTDDELIRLIRGGAPDAFEELVRRTRRPAYRLARRITRNHEDADDVVQESFVKAYRAIDRFTLGKAIAPWVLTIVARTALSWRSVWKGTCRTRRSRKPWAFPSGP